MRKREDKSFKWTPAREMALKLVFEGRWTQEEIARKLVEAEDAEAADADETTTEPPAADDATKDTEAKLSERVRISTRTLRRWITHADFQQRLEAMRADLATTLRTVAYADKGQRVVGLSQMAEAARREFEARPWLKEVRPSPDGEITNESFNRDAHAAFRGALDDIAAELGARKNVTDVNAILNLSGQIGFYLPEPESAPHDDPPSAQHDQ